MLRHALLPVLVSTLAVAIAMSAMTPPAAAKTSRCTRLASSVTKSKKFLPQRYASRLERLAKRDKACTEAPNQAYERLLKDWRLLIPEATKRVPRAVVLKTLSRYRALVAYLKGVMRFPKFDRRAAAMLMLAQLHDAMATYIEQAGNGPRTVFLVKERGAVYHEKAVDLRELLMLEAERTYAFVVRLLANASKLNETKVQAKAGLAGIRAKLEARKVVLPPLPVEEDETVIP